MRQLIIARKDLNMSAGKLAAQVAHASIAFLSWPIRTEARKLANVQIGRCVQKDVDGMPTGQYQPYKHPDLDKMSAEAFAAGDSFFYYKKDPDNPFRLTKCDFNYDDYIAEIVIPKDIYEEWLCGIFTKTICEAKNLRQLMKVVDAAEELGLKENKDYFIIKDKCLTELEPEEEDGTVITCIGFRPLDEETAHTLSKKYQLYR